jgi:hypothetical protein
MWVYFFVVVIYSNNIAWLWQNIKQFDIGVNFQHDMRLGLVFKIPNRPWDNWILL